MSFSGTEVQLALPAGTEHDVWKTGNRSLCLMQAVADVDFKVETKFDSSVQQNSQMQGLIVEQDANNYLRFDQYFDGTNVHLFVAKFVGANPTALSNTTLSGSTFAPFWLRVQRTGSGWTYTWSADGTTFNTATTFTFNMSPTRIGPFVGNCGAVHLLHSRRPSIISGISARQSAQRSRAFHQLGDHLVDDRPCCNWERQLWVNQFIREHRWKRSAHHQPFHQPSRFEL